MERNNKITKIYNAHLEHNEMLIKMIHNFESEFNLKKGDKIKLTYIDRYSRVTVTTEYFYLNVSFRYEFNNLYMNVEFSCVKKDGKPSYRLIDIHNIKNILNIEKILEYENKN